MSRFDLDVLYARAKAKLWSKVERLRILEREGPLRVSDFGTRRRHGFLWQRWCVEAMQEGLGDSFIGTSNVKHAMDTGLEAIGTNAHELPMVYAAIADDDEELREAPYKVLKDWAKMYGGNLLVVLPDCFGTTAFLRNAPDWVADWKGARPDSKLPIEGARELIDWWKRRGRDPREKLVVLSDAMDIDSIEEFGARAARAGQPVVRLGHQPDQRLHRLRAGRRRRRAQGDLARLQGGRGGRAAGGQALRQSEQGARAAGRGRALPAGLRSGRHEKQPWRSSLAIPRKRVRYGAHDRGPKPAYIEEAMSHIAFPRLDQTILARRDAIVERLAAILPPECLIADESGRRAFETDALTAYRRLPLAVALPRSTEEVARVLRFCRDEKVNVVPRGAGTSLSGGAIPQEDAVVIALTKMSRILEVNLADRYARVEAGVTNLAISEAVGAGRLLLRARSVLAARLHDRRQYRMNSGGAHCLKYGVTTNNLLGVRLVTLDGEILDIGGEAMDAPGYDLLGLVCGSEGQLGIVTEATVRLIPLPEGARPVLFGFDSVEDASQCVAAIIGAGIVPVAMEYMDKPAIHICENFAHAGYPLDVEAMLIIEVEGTDAEIGAMLARIGAIAKAHNVRTVRELMSAMESAQIWKGRKSAFGATGRVADYICMDGTVPTGRLPEALQRTGEICASFGLRVANVFHAGDGNMHPLILYNVNDADERDKAEAAGADILEMCVELGGCLTGEHGVGIEKRDLMGRQFTDVELAQQKRVRAVFDPDGRLNPAKVFPLGERAA